MSNFSSKTKYVEARPRREKKLGRGGSVVSVVANGGSSGVSKSYVDSNFVTLATEQAISGPKDFVGGIKVNGMPIVYNAELGVWEFTGDLFVTGNFAWGSSIDGFKPSTVMDAVRVDRSTIIKKKDANGDWYLYAPGGGSGGSGGGLTLGDVVGYLSDNDYTTKTDVNSLIASALVGYATQSWVGDNYLAKSGGGLTLGDVVGYLSDNDYTTKTDVNSLIASALVGYATQTWVGDNYLSKSGGTISGSVTISTPGWQNQLVLNGQDSNAGIQFRYSDSVVASFFCAQTQPYWMRGDNAYNILHSGNIGSYNAGSATKLQTPRTIWGQSFDGTENITHGFRSLYADSYNGGVAHSILNNQGSPYGLLTRIFGNGSVSLQAQREANDAECFNLLLNHLGGNVAIGGTTADAKLHVHGNTMVDGELYFNHKTILRLDNSNTWVNYGGANDGLDLRLCGRELIFQYGRGDAFARAMTITSGGNLAIGGSTADAKLHVYGNIITTGNIEGGIFGLQNSSPDNPLFRLTVGNQNYYVQATSDGIYLGPTSALSLKVDANGNTTINGNLLVYGNVSWLSHSQRSLKNIISEQGLSLAQLERIRPIKFYWKDGRDMALHVGGVADVFAEVLPEVVARNLQDILCLNYVDAAFYVGASLIAPVLDHERRITKGEAEQEALKKENAKLKRELVEVKRKLNHLVA